MIVFRRKAVFFNDNGEWEKTVKIKKGSKTFNYKNKTYTFDEKKSFFRTTGLIFVDDYYFYNINKEEAFKFEKQTKSVLSPSKLYQIIETDWAKKLSQAAMKSDFSGLLTPKNILIGLAILGALMYFLQGGTLA